jgi:multidrug efflux pump subunit AcrA (membrane-fusion protein)
VLQPVEKRSICPPYDGSIEEVFFKPGEAVKKGQLLARMRTTDMTMKLGQAQQQMQQYYNEAEKNRFDLPAKMSEYRIAKARMEVAAKQAELLDYQIKQADLVAPFDGVLSRGRSDRQRPPAGRCAV